MCVNNLSHDVEPENAEDFLRNWYLNELILTGCASMTEIQHEGYWYTPLDFFSAAELMLLGKIAQNNSDSLWDVLTVDMLERALVLVDLTNYGRRTS
jgi:hypothetical protein